MELHELLWWHAFCACEDLAGTLVRFPHLSLFFLGHRQDSEREDFVDFGPVKQTAGAFRSDLRVVVENDGRRKDGVPVSFFAYQYRPGTDIATLFDLTL